MEQLIYLMDTYPWIKTLVAVLLIARPVFKTTFLILGKYVELTIEEDDNKKLHKFMQTKTYKMLAFLVDTIASIKMPTIKKKEQ